LTSRTKRINRHTHFTYPVKKARLRPGGIDVQVQYKNGITSPWMSMDCTEYYIGVKKYNIRSIDEHLCDLLTNQDARVRIPKIEKEQASELKRARKRRN